jgi:hypothetical protein
MFARTFSVTFIKIALNGSEVQWRHGVRYRTSDWGACAFDIQRVLVLLYKLFYVQLLFCAPKSTNLTRQITWAEKRVVLQNSLFFRVFSQKSMTVLWFLYAFGLRTETLKKFYDLPAVYICVLCRSGNKQRLFPYSALSGWLLKPSGRCMYHHFNIQVFVLPTQYTVCMCFLWIWEQTAIISLYNINWLVFITHLTLQSPVATICTTSLTFNNSTFCPRSVCVLYGSQNKHRLFPYTALTDWFL